MPSLTGAQGKNRDGEVGRCRTCIRRLHLYRQSPVSGQLCLIHLHVHIVENLSCFSTTRNNNLFTSSTEPAEYHCLQDFAIKTSQKPRNFFAAPNTRSPPDRNQIDFHPVLNKIRYVQLQPGASDAKCVVRQGQGMMHPMQGTAGGVPPQKFVLQNL